MNHNNYDWEFFIEPAVSVIDVPGVWISREDSPYETGVTDIWIDMQSWKKIVESWIQYLHGTEEE